MAEDLAFLDVGPPFVHVQVGAADVGGRELDDDVGQLFKLGVWNSGRLRPSSGRDKRVLSWVPSTLKRGSPRACSRMGLRQTLNPGSRVVHERPRGYLGHGRRHLGSCAGADRGVMRISQGRRRACGTLSRAMKDLGIGTWKRETWTENHEAALVDFRRVQPFERNALPHSISLCYASSAGWNSRRHRGQRHSKWIRVWPETARSPYHRKPSAFRTCEAALVALAGRPVIGPCPRRAAAALRSYDSNADYLNP